MTRARFSFFSLFAVAFTSALLLAIQAASGQQTGAVNFRQIDEVVSGWKQSQHVYVKGNLGIGYQQLAELDAWLEKYGPHWTVVLMQNAEDQVYNDAEGRRFYGMDAVEYALGHGLANRTGFGRLEHPETKETDGAVFVLFLQERKFSYYGSDAQDRRALGESRWVGDLDREAIRAMRGGGRIIDAVKNTVVEINEQLADKIVAEKAEAERRKQQAEQEKLERQRTLANTLARIADGETKLLAEIEKSAALFKQTYPEAANSTLAAPPLDKWRNQLKEFRSTINEMNSRELSQKVEQQRNELETFLDGYAVHRNFVEAVEPLQSRWDQVTTFGRGIATESSREAEKRLERAKELHRLGDIAFVSELDQARMSLDRADQEIFAEKKRMEEEAATRRAIRNALYTAGGLLLLILGFIAWMLNRRRRPSLQRAYEAYGKAEPFVSEKLATVEPLLKQSEQTLGNEKSFSRRNFSGKTLELGQQLLQQQGQLQEMVKEARQVLKAASGTMHPFSPLAQLSNMVSSGPYEYALNLLSGQSLKLPDELKHFDRVDPIGWIGFAEFTSVTGDLAEALDEGLKRFSQATASAAEETKQLQTDLESLSVLEQRNSKAAKADGLFELSGLFTGLLPGLQAAQDKAEAMVATDPVGAREDILMAARQRVSDVKGIIEAVLAAREETWPQLLTAKKELEGMGLRTGWLLQRLQQLSGEANRLIASAGEQAITEEASRFINELKGLGPQVERGLTLAKTLDKETANSLAKLGETILSGRQRVASALGLVPTSVLAESTYNPDLRLEAAKKQLAAARSALDYGKFAAAEEALGTISVEADRAQKLVSESLEVLENFDRNVQRIQDQTNQIEQRVAESERKVLQAKSAYAPSALEFQSIGEPGQFEEAKPAEAAARGVEACQASCRELLQDARASLKQADERFRGGKLLEAANLVHLAEEELSVIQTRLGGMAKHFESLAEAERQNSQSAASLRSRIDELRRGATDQRVIAATVQRIEQLTASSGALLAELSSARGGKRDPLSDARRLSAAEHDVEELIANSASDIEAHAEATRAVTGAKVELEVAMRLVEHARNDQIPDSLTVTRCRQRIEQLAQQVAVTASELNVAHSDWGMTHEAASHQTAELGVVSGELRNELQLASSSAEEFKSASQEVYRAASWSGSYGVRVINNPGAEELEQARMALASGDYQKTADLSQAAANLAREAIAVAERMVQRKRREIQQNQERRRRSDDDFWGGFGGSIFTGGGGWSSGSSSSSSGGGWSSGGGGWSSGGSSSGGSWGGSSGGSDSGFGRSGW